jgi:DNA-binding NarL/FixJ family response regulator
MIESNEKANLLIVEDDRFIRKLYIEILKGIDTLEIHELDSAENAINYIKESKPDLVIMDYRLPGMNGLEATKQIIMAHPDTIVLVISGDDRSTLEEEMLEVGAISFLKKPVRGKLLYFTIMNFVEIILTKKRLKMQIDQQTVKQAEDRAASSYTCKPIQYTTTKDKSNTFVDSFENNEISQDAGNVLSGGQSSDTKSAVELFNTIEDFEYIEDFLDSFERLTYDIDTLSTIVETHILHELKDIIRENATRLNMLLEFPTLTYTLSSIADFMEVQDIENMCDIPMKKFAVFLQDFFDMYSQWVKSVFINKDADDIHYMDVTLMSYGLQVDSIFSDVNVLTEDDESAIDEGGSVEFF